MEALMIKQFPEIIISVILITMVVACSGGSMSDKNVSYESLKKVPDSAWDSLSTKKFYFGHQSVGNNILDGVNSILKENPSIKLNVVKTIKKSDFKNGIIAHSSIGSNADPQSKVDAFVRNIKEGIGNEADAVALKFCYIDFNRETDSQKVFEGYKLAIEDVKKQYPSLKVVHMTVPLLKIQTGPKAWVKKIIGRPLDGINDNIKRLEYNDLLIKTFGATDPIFDVSKAESTYPDGKRESFKKDGKTYYAMVPAYTNDGGHLNETGKKIVAEQFLLFLINNL
jgi:hypothetical protein